ncbi:MAG TPA: maleylpyruvate isomerase family mycothiol-dependent enzyme [Acidimicrobiales bacterium]|nr:maleylpyruvate isomerase family mycothiol-dependent enzyme [Acidimicrobiales bacterium]
MDYDQLRLQEMAAISEFLHELDEEQWDHLSLCDGWRVRDVISHICLGYTTPMPSMIVKVARRGFNVPKASFEESIAYGTAHSPAEILAVFNSIHRGNVRKGIAKVIKPTEGLVDHLIHHQDVRRPLGRPRSLPEDRLVAALGVIPNLAGFVGAKKRVAGLRLVATDVGWSNGDGPEVAGTGEAILLAASGRPVSLDELSGEGLDLLRTRVAA